jgi:hypothetical protein
VHLYIEVNERSDFCEDVSFIESGDCSCSFVNGHQPIKFSRECDNYEIDEGKGRC